MRFIRGNVTTTPCSTGTVPPARLLAADRATTGTCSSEQIRTTSATSAAFPGSTTTSGKAVSGLASY
jgi:hypothetical protein